MSGCVQPCAETIAALSDQVRRLTRQIESLTRQVSVLTERQQEATELEHIIRRVKFAPYVDAPHHQEPPPRHLRLVR